MRDGWPADGTTLTADVWGAAVLAGLLGLVAVLLLQDVLAPMVALPHQQDLDPTKYPSWSVAAWVIMGALVAGIAEEASFRGYLQRPIERRHGPIVAILVTGLLFGLAHFTHPEVSIALMPYFLAVAAVYGMLAYLTDSIQPSVALHAGGNLFSALGFFTRGRSEWQTRPTPQPLIWQTGADASFWGSVVAFIAAAVAATWAYVVLARVAREAKAEEEREGVG